MGWPWFEQEAGVGGDAIFEPVERSQIVEDPEGPSVSGDDEVVVLHDKVMYGDPGQIQKEGLPVTAVIEADVDGGLSAGVEETSFSGVFSNHPSEVVPGEYRG